MDALLFARAYKFHLNTEYSRLMLVFAQCMAVNMALKVYGPSIRSRVVFSVAGGVSAIASSIAKWRLRIPASPVSGAILFQQGLALLGGHSEPRAPIMVGLP